MRPKFQLRSRDKILELGLRTRLMGVLNVTPDSFYDGAQHLQRDHAISYGLQLIEEGADIVDIGGQSTRPGAQPVGTEEELRRILPVLSELRRRSNGWLSVDTYRSEVARVSLE